MPRLRNVMPYLLSLLLALVVWGCVEQEPDRPTEEDKRLIRQNILTKVPEMKFKVNADLEGNVTYLGLDVDKDVIQPGQQFTLTHYWKVNKRVDGWRLFVHLNGPDKKGFINADHKAIGGRYPATNWQPGEILRDEHKVTLPADYKESKVMVFVGLWKGKLRMKIKGPQDNENRVLAATIPVSGGAPPKPFKARRLNAVKTSRPVQVDGVLDEPVWSKSTPTGPFVNTMDGSPVPFRTEAKAAWDDKFLYVAFQCEDDDVWSDFKNRDDKLWTQEAVEVFIDADGDGKDYIELQVNAHGAIFDSYLPEYRKNQNDWNSKLKAAVKVDGTLNKRDDKDKSYTVEIAIPWDDVKGRGTKAIELPPRPGSLFKVNFFRMDLPKGSPQRASAWSPPMVGDFHALNKFGELAFANEDGDLPAGTAATAPVPAVAPAVAPGVAPGVAPARPFPGKTVNMEGLQHRTLKARLMPTKVRPTPKKESK